MKRLSLLVVVAFVVFACAPLPKAPSADEAAEIERLLARVLDASFYGPEWRSDRDRLVAYDEAALPYLLREMRECTLYTRPFYGNIVKRLPSPRVSSALADEVRREPDPTVRSVLVETLAERADFAAARAMGDIVLNHPDPWLRAEIMLGLGRAGCPLPCGQIPPDVLDKFIDNENVRPNRHASVLREVLHRMPLRFRFHGLPMSTDEPASAILFTVTNASSRALTVDPRRFFVVAYQWFAERPHGDTDCTTGNPSVCSVVPVNSPETALAPGHAIIASLPITAYLHLYGRTQFSDRRPAFHSRRFGPCPWYRRFPSAEYDFGSGEVPLHFIVAYIPRVDSSQSGAIDMFSTSGPVFF